jgi:hypothetical protein
MKAGGDVQRDKRNAANKLERGTLTDVPRDIETAPVNLGGVTEQSQLVPLRARVRPEIVRALHEEALARRLTPGRFLAELLAETLPSMAAERVRRQVAPARPLRVVSNAEVESLDDPSQRGAP